jgi:hypothetical protein
VCTRTILLSSLWKLNPFSDATEPY